MEISEFIKELGRGIYDPTMLVIAPEEWLAMVNFQGGEMYPEIAYRGIITQAWADDYQIDLSAYTDIADIREVYLENADGDKSGYDNWVYNKEIKILDLSPTTSRDQGIDPADYTNMIIVWQGYLPTFGQESDTINLPTPKLVLLKKICTREAARRILLDHAKLDRYRTLIGRMNEYSLIALVNQYTLDIERSKSKLADTHQVRSF